MSKEYINNPLVNPICWACRRDCRKDSISIYGPRFWGGEGKLIGILGTALGLSEDIIEETINIYSQLSRHFSRRGRRRTLLALAALYIVPIRRKKWSSPSIEEFLLKLPKPPCRPYGWAMPGEIQKYCQTIQK
jgi:hypothetical protein